MVVVDKLCYRSGLRYVNTAEKAAFAMVSLIICISSRSMEAAVLAILVNGILTAAAGKIPCIYYIRMMLGTLAFLVLSTLTIIVNWSETPLDAYAFSVGNHYITGSTSSVVFGIRLILTALGAVSCLLFLSLNTTMTALLGMLSRVGCPWIIVELMLLIYRFVFLLLETAGHIRTAQNSRLGNHSYRASVRSFGQMSAVLLVKAMKRADALYDAMLSRGYDGQILVIREDRKPERKEIAAICIYLFLLAAVAFWRKI